MPGTPDQYSYPTFAASIAHGRVNEFLTLLARVEDPDDVAEFQGQTLLHFAVSQKKTWAVRQLLERGADPDLLTLNRNTALDIALDPLSPAPEEIVALLRGRGAQRREELPPSRIHAQLEKKYLRHAAEKPLDVRLLRVIVRNHPQKEQGFVLDYMQRHGGHNPLHDAAAEGRTELAKFWLELGLPADTALKDGRTAFDIEAAKEIPDPEMLDVIAFYRKKGDAGFFGGGIADETRFEIPAAATLDDFRKVMGPVATDTLLYRVARFGDVARIRSAALSGGFPLTVAELTEKTPAGRSVLEIVSERGFVGILLDPRLWKGRKAELGRLFDHLGPEKTAALPVHRMLAETDILLLKEKAARKNAFRL